MLPTGAVVVIALLNILGVCVIGLVLGMLGGGLAGALMRSKYSARMMTRDLVWTLAGLGVSVLVVAVEWLIGTSETFAVSHIYIGAVLAPVLLRFWTLRTQRRGSKKV